MNFEHGLLYYYKKQYRESITCFLQALEEVTLEQRIESCFYLSLCYEQLGETDNERNILLQQFTYENPRPEICCRLGSYYMREKSYDDAIYWFKLATRLSCKHLQ